MLLPVFSTKLLILGILFSTALTAVLVAKLAILGISPLTTFILALVTKLVILAILSSIFFILVLYTSFLMASFVTSFNLLNRKEQVIIYQHLIYLLCSSNLQNFIKFV